MKRCLVAALALSLSACHEEKTPPPQPAASQAVSVRLAAVQEASMTPRLAVRAEVFTLDDALVVSQQAGTVRRLDFAPGSSVRAGQTLVQLDTDALAIQLARAQASVGLRRAAWLDSARRTERRERARASSPALVTQEALELSASDAAMRRAELKVAEQEARAADLALQRASIRAPCAGVVQSREVALGQHVPVGATLGRVAGGGPRHLRFYMPSALAAQVPVGARLQVDSEAAGIREGVVSFVGASADVATRQVEVQAVLRPQEPASLRCGREGTSGVSVQSPACRPLHPGSSVGVSLQLPERRAVTVPRSAVFPSEAGLAVYVAQEGLAQLRPITVLAGEGQRLEVQSGLQAGDCVVVDDLQRLHPGAAIEARPAQVESAS